MSIYARLADLERRGEPGVTVTVIAVAGSTPRAAGAKMLITRDGSVGSIGGGQLEFLALETAQAMLDQGAAAPVIRDIALGPAVNQCCGGQVVLLFEPLVAPRLRLALYGAGHVARALVAKLADLPIAVDWIDPRPDAFPVDLPDQVCRIVTERPVAAAGEIPPGAFHLVMTHDHTLDFELVAAIIARGDSAWLGLIGSKTKRQRFARRLAAQGLDPAPLVCPVGRGDIVGKEPGVVAVAILAELLALTPPARRESARGDWAALRRAARPDPLPDSTEIAPFVTGHPRD